MAEAADAAEQVDLEGADADIRRIGGLRPAAIAVAAAIAAVADRGPRAGIDMGEKIGALDAELSARGRDIGGGHAKVAIVDERGIDQRLQVRIAEYVTPGNARQRRLALPEIGVAGRPARRHRRLRALIVWLHRASGERQRGGGGEEARGGALDHALASGAGAVGGASSS